MKHFKPGEFERHRVHSALRPFCPLAAVHAITELNLDDLARSGKELILLDVDNTLVEWKQEEFAPSVIGWIEEAKAKGFSLYILSNTRHPARLNRISERLGIPYIRDRFKPSTKMYNLALAQTGKQPSQAIMIGDQIFTDILGANRAGIEAVWVHRISPREFVGTRFLSRMMERLLVPLLNRALPIMSKMPDPVGAPEETPLLTQLFRFGVVGASSFVIDTGVLLLLSSVIGFGGHKLGTTVGTWLIQDQIAFFGHYEDPVRAASVFFKPVSTSVAMLNSFFWKNF
jgi:HAD superfamily phosphatase (TIGR01668 family)